MFLFAVIVSIARVSETNFEQKMSSLLFFSHVTEMSDNFDSASVSASIILEKKKMIIIELMKI